MSEREEHSNPAVLPAHPSLPPQPSGSSGRKNQSEIWEHFIPIEGIEKYARCKNCNGQIKYAGGTSAMRQHWKRCFDSNNEQSKRQRIEGETSGPISSPSVTKFDQAVSRSILTEMFVTEELAFRFVERNVFRRLLHSLQPKFKIPSRTTLARDILSFYETEKMKLQSYLSHHCQKVCLTTDTWTTSSQNLTYMSLTAHFIDNDWKLQKRILNFCRVEGHSGEVLGRAIEVKDGLKEIDDSITRICNAVKYVKSSPMRCESFKACIERESINYKGPVSLDVETRWNSTYLMLEAALKLRATFDLLELQDDKYINELSKSYGVPTDDDWTYAESILPFLKIFYDATLRISGSLDVTSNKYMKEVFRKIKLHCENTDLSIRLMASKMQRKYDKYWRTPNVINMLLLIAIVLDPCHKLNFVNWILDESFGVEKGGELKSKLSICLNSLYNHYQGKEDESQSNQDAMINEEDEDDILNIYLQSTGRDSDAKSELDRYLKEDCEPRNKSAELDILGW
ncbi:zinc finger BED domain-containing protein RICESLEEPER 2-like [Arachis hypogaea]|uniref:zinc finger BED domain-containing protein RICESLEEPER 2-like n=1 Tax=Arachis hypogaea TaxID=3818 RepID=UPI003B20E590